MLLEYLQTNYMTVLLIITMGIIMLVYKDYDIPVSSMVPIAIVLVLIGSVSYFISDWCSAYTYAHQGEDISNYVLVRRIASVTNYVSQPLSMMFQFFLIIPKEKHSIYLALPAIFNTVVYLIAPFTGKLIFRITDKGVWERGPLGYTVFIVSMFYAVAMLVASLHYFRDKNRKKALIILTIFLLIVTAGVLEYTNLVGGMVDEIGILIILLYYVYLITIYQEELRETLAEQELRIAEARLSILQEQIRPHFIFNSLGIIRSLVKHDQKQAIATIDSFSDYLRVHVWAMKNNEVVPFEAELVHVKSILTLVQSDYTKKVEVTYDLKETGFRLPPLTLEPLVENAIKYGLDKNGGEIQITTERIERENDVPEIVIRVIDSGRGKGDITEKEQHRLGVGLDNTRTRLKLQCDATLTVTTGETGAVAEIRMPLTQNTTL